MPERSGWCSGRSTRLSLLRPGFDPPFHLVATWVWLPIPDLTGFLQILRFPAVSGNLSSFLFRCFKDLKWKNTAVSGPRVSSAVGFCESSSGHYLGRDSPCYSCLRPIMPFNSANAYLTSISRSKVRHRLKVIWHVQARSSKDSPY